MPDMQDDFVNSQTIENSSDDAKIKDICEKIDILLDSYCQENGIENLRQETQQVFVGGLMYVYFNLFAQDKSLLRLYTPGISNDKCITNMYNDYIVWCICQYYIFICHKYNKITKPIDFSYLTGIDLDTLKRWESMESQRPQAYGTIKRLLKTYESGLENGAQSGKNPVGFIATLNHRFGWSADNKPSLTVNITRSKNEILSTYNQNLIDETSENGVK